jgi:hypothetical protein
LPFGGKSLASLSSSSEWTQSMFKLAQEKKFENFLEAECGINIGPNGERIWSWMGSLGLYKNENWSHKCGASIIDDRRVITAAHCALPESVFIQE